MNKDKYTSKQIAPHVMRFEYKNTGKVYFRVTFIRKGLKFCRYITPEDNTDEEKNRALNIAIRLAKRIAVDLLEPVTQEHLAEMFDFYKNAQLALPEDKETTETKN